MGRTPASEIREGDSLLIGKREFVVSDIEVNPRTGRIRIGSETRGTLYFDLKELVERYFHGVAVWCDECEREADFVDGSCTSCAERRRSKMAEERSASARFAAASAIGARTHDPSGNWNLDANNAAQMSDVFVRSVEMMASHPLRGRASVQQGDLLAAEYWFNETADSAFAAYRVPTAYRDLQAVKRIKRLRDQSNGETWGAFARIGDADTAIGNLYLDAAMAHSVLVLDNVDQFAPDDRLDDRVARHYRDTLIDRVNGGPTNEEELIRIFRAIRFEVVDPLVGMTWLDARRLALLTGTPMMDFLRIHQVGAKVMSKIQWKALQRTAYRNVLSRLWKLAHRQELTNLFKEMRFPGAGELACIGPDPNPRPMIGWFPDPGYVHEFRYFDGRVWTADVSNGGRSSSDPAPLGSINDRPD